MHQYYQAYSHPYAQPIVHTGYNSNHIGSSPLSEHVDYQNMLRYQQQVVEMSINEWDEED